MLLMEPLIIVFQFPTDFCFTDLRLVQTKFAAIHGASHCLRHGKTDSDIAATAFKYV